MTYQDVLSAPTYERRFFLHTLVGENKKKEEAIEERRQQSQNSNAKGTRTTTVGGQQLKSKLLSGEIPN